MINFPLAKTRHRESYAEFVETVLTTNYYRSITGDNNFEYNLARQGLNNVEQDTYTPFFVDLEDDFNQRAELGNNTLPNDDVNGYSLREIEDAVFKRTNFSGVVRELQKLNKPTENNLRELRNHWGD